MNGLDFHRLEQKTITHIAFITDVTSSVTWPRRTEIRTHIMKVHIYVQEATTRSDRQESGQFKKTWMSAICLLMIAINHIKKYQWV